jgi:hypothetical protein
MGGVIPLLPLSAFMAWTGRTSFFLPDTGGFLFRIMLVLQEKDFFTYNWIS